VKKLPFAVSVLSQDITVTSWMTISDQSILPSTTLFQAELDDEPTIEFTESVPSRKAFPYFTRIWFDLTSQVAFLLLWKT
jgi:hypothetical protein